MARLGSTISAVIMIGILAAGGVMSIVTLLKPELRATMTKPVPGYDYLDGKLTSSVEGNYKLELPIRAPSVDLLNAFTLALFGEGRKGVVVGARGWLFTAEEYDWTVDSPDNLAANLHHIAAVADELRHDGIALEIALVPEKADIYADLLTHPRPAAHDGEYEAVRARLIALTNAPVPDLRDLLLTARRNAEMFFPTDTHWTVAGAGDVARDVAAAFPASTDIPTADFALKPQAAVTHAGDLLNFLQLGPFVGLLPATTSSVAPVLAVADGGNVGDFLGDSPPGGGPQVALVGTSYSAITTWSFEAQLKAALHRDVVNFAEEGHGPLLPMDDFLAKLRAGEVKVKAVIWEMPLRYLDDAPDTIQNKSVASAKG